MSAPPPEELETKSPEYIAYTNGPTLIAKVSSIWAIAIVIVLARSYVRTRIVKSFGKDDWAMLIAMMTATAFYICYVIEIKSFGLGKHTPVIQADEKGYRQLLKLRMIHQVIVGVGMSSVKVSISFFLLRLVTRRLYIWSLRSIIIFFIVFTTVCALTIIFECVPVQAIWDVRLRPPPRGTGTAKCLADDTYIKIGLFNGIVHILTDFLLALLPAPMVWRLQMPFRTRVSLVIVLALGIFAAIAGIVRQMAVSDFALPDAWIHDRYTVWSFVELGIGIIAASLPSLKPLFSWFYNAALSKPGISKLEGFRGHTIGGGYKEHSPSGTDDLEMDTYKTSWDVQISSQPPSSSERWNMQRANASEDSILLRDENGQNSGGITVMNRVEVN